MSITDMAASAPKATRITAALLVIGDEILSGRTRDTNTGYIAAHLTAIGIELREVRVVADDEAAIVEAVTVLRARYRYLFTTGGIGPTHDDITADSIAKALGVSIDVDPRALALMKPHYERRGLALTPPRLRMARIPAGAELIENSISIAPGFMIENVIVMAGVPAVMQVMLDSVTPRLEKGRLMRAEAIDLAVPEGEIAELLADHQKAYPAVSMGSYPSFRTGRPLTQLVLRSTDETAWREAVAGLKTKLRQRGLM